jgi:hypothetical protein
MHCQQASEEGEAPRSLFRTSVGLLYSSTRIVFTGDRKADVERGIFAASLEYRVTPRFSVAAGLGAVLLGDMRFLPAVSSDVHAFASGLSTSVTGAYRLLAEEGFWPFVGLSLSLGGALAKTTTPRGSSVGYQALDLRLGAAVGKTFANRIALYVTGRVFGGPIAWKLNGEALTGTDIYKYQVGAGGSLALVRGLDVYLEGIAFGERMVSGGVGFSY